MFGFDLTEYDKKVYEEEIDGFLPKNFIDCHTHVYTVDSKKVKKGPVYWPSRVAVDNSIEDIIQTYKDLFPNQKVVPVIFGTPGGILPLTNAYCSEKSKEYGYPALFIPHFNDSPEFVEEQVIKGGFQGLKPYLNNCKDGVKGSDANIFEFLNPEHLKIADKYGWKVILHISKPDRLKDPQNIRELMEIEQKYPNVKLIVAHIGRAYTKADLGDAFETLKHTKNMMFDFCANTLPEATEQCINAVGTKRIMFGSDLPIAKMRMYRVDENGYYVNVVPRGLYGDLTNAEHMRETDEPNVTNFMYEIIRGFKKTVNKLGLTKADVEDIMCNNAAKLFNVKF
ncbi:MAG: amidohydrolase family protein [Clostridia bacterium]|nr:amidohydrolase family protein [Clostridia bacterium]